MRDGRPNWDLHGMGDPTHQFEIVKLFTIGRIGGWEIAFTNSALFMLIAAGLIALLLLATTTRRAMVPGRMQSIAEMSYEFVANTVRANTGPEGMRFFPLVFTLFMFILMVNLLGMIPYTFTVTSHIIVTVMLSLVVFLTVVIYGIWHNGLKFFKLFVPSGIPVYILPLVSAIEVISFMSRPVSHSVRLFANMLAGHITLKVFAAFVVMLSGFGIAGWVGAILPLALTVALSALELLVAVLQAYVFAILTCIYLNDAIHPGH
jgi:F-type H+-transporting ATPase subunit a